MDISSGLAAVISAVLSSVTAIVVIILQNRKISEKIEKNEGVTLTKIDKIDESARKITVDENTKMLDAINLVSSRLETLELAIKSNAPPVGSDKSEGNGGAAVKTYHAGDFARDWLIVRDYLEMVAAEEEDGRTRAKYSRIDRRKYDELIHALNDDGAITALQCKAFAEVYGLWPRYRRLKNIEVAVSDADLNTMERALRLIPPNLKS